MENAEFRIRTGRPFRRTILGVFLVYAVAGAAYLYLGVQPSFSGKASAYAKEAAEASGVLEIPSISLSAPVSNVELSGRKLSVPDYIVGRYFSYENRVLLMGHSSTVFTKLSDVKVGDEISYNGQVYRVTSREIRPKAEISMREILEDVGEPTLVLMTCAGEHVSGQDYSHRLIIDAVMSGV